MEHTGTSDGSSRRSVLRNSAVGMGALLAGATVTAAVAAPADAAAPADVPAAVVPAAAVAAAAVSAPGKYFLTLTGISGSSVDSSHTGAIDLINSSWGLTGGTGKPAFSAFHFTALTGVDSPLLFLYCATGKTIKLAQLDIVQNAQLGVNIRVLFGNARVTAYSTQNTGTPQQIDTVSLTFTHIDFRYAPVRADGSLGASVSASWDLPSNSPG